MRNLTLIILAASAITGCSRKSFPTTTLIIKDSLVIRDSVRLRDSVITIPGEQIQIIDTINWVTKETDSDTTHYNKTVKKGNLTANLDIDHKGIVRFTCKADSLQQRIEWLEHHQFSLQTHTEYKTVQVPGPVITKTHIPRWIWFYLIGSFVYFLWPYRLVLLSGGGWIVSFLKGLITKK